MIHSPFHIITEFFSPAVCEEIIDELGIKSPSYELDEETPIPHNKLLTGTRFYNMFRNTLAENLPEIEKRYNGEAVSMSEPQFSQFFENPKAPCVPHGCESSKLLKRKWVKIKDVDLVGYLWLKDYNGSPPLDVSFEVYGSKLEFPAYNFSLMPERGTCVIFPAGPHFITAVSHVFVGTSEYIKFGIKLIAGRNEDGEIAWFYNPTNFPGTYVEWFK